MKNLIIIILITVCTLSCKKDYDCWCTSNELDKIDYEPIKIKDTKRKSLKKCKTYEVNNQIGPCVLQEN